MFLFYRGRVALKALLVAAGIGEGDKVALQAYTCSAVPEGIKAAGAVPVFIDVKDHGLTMDAVCLETAIRDDIRAIVFQHTFGIPDGIDEVAEIAKRHDLLLIEDCCHSFSSSKDGVSVGNFGDGAFYSFEWGKPVPLGIGGGAVSSNSEIYNKLAADFATYRSPGRLVSFGLLVQKIFFRALYRPSTYWSVKSAFRLASKLGMVSGNYSSVGALGESGEFSMKMAGSLTVSKEEIQRRAERFSEISGKIVQRYGQLLSGSTSKINSIDCIDESEVVFSRFPLWVEGKSAFVELARKMRVEVADWYMTPIHPFCGEELGLVNYELGQCPNAELATQHVVTLPINVHVNQQYFERIDRLFREYVL